MPYNKDLVGEPDGSDFASVKVSVLMSRIKKQMQKDIEIVMEDQFPEQSIIVSLISLRLIGERFPRQLSNEFSANDLEKTKSAFYSWYEMAEKKIPKKHREALLENAEQEFKLFKETFFSLG